MRIRHPRQARRCAALALSALTLAACGSTVKVGGAGAPVGSTGDGAVLAEGGVEPGLDAGSLVVPGGPALPGSAESTGSAGGGSSGSSGSSSGGTSGGAGGSSGGSGGRTSGGSTGSSAGGGSTAPGPGITSTKIFIGAPWNSDADAGNAALGVTEANSGDERDYWAAVLEDLNSRGGILGRKMEVVFAEYRAASNEPAEAQDQAACDKWTKDNKVFAVYGGGSDIMLECTRKAGVLATSGGSATGPVYRKYPQLVDVSGIRFERLGQVSVDGLAKSGYFKPDPRWPTGKVGFVSWDTADSRYAFEHGYVPALKRQGITMNSDNTAWIAEPATVNALGDASAAISSAVLRFQSQDIDHVFLQDGPAGVFRGGGLTILFLRTAESQSYRPRYGFNANNFPGDPNLPPEQQSGMLAVDYADYEPAKDEGIGLNQQRERCFAIMKAKGLSVADPQKMATAAGMCGFTWFLETLLKRAATPTLTGVIRAAEGLGTSFHSPSVYGTRLGPGRHDGVELVRAARFDDDCDCMKYTTKPYVP